MQTVKMINFVIMCLFFACYMYQFLYIPVSWLPRRKSRADAPLLELRPRMATLEDVFLDLTDDDDTVAAKAAALLGGAGQKPEPAGEDGGGREAAASEQPDGVNEDEEATNA